MAASKKHKNAKSTANNLAWYKMQWNNMLQSYHRKCTKNCGRKKQGNKDSLAEPFHNQIMNLAILIFGGSSCYFVECFEKNYFWRKLETWYYIYTLWQISKAAVSCKVGDFYFLHDFLMCYGVIINY